MIEINYLNYFIWLISKKEFLLLERQVQILYFEGIRLLLIANPEFEEWPRRRISFVSIQILDWSVTDLGLDRGLFCWFNPGSIPFYRILVGSIRIVFRSRVSYSPWLKVISICSFRVGFNSSGFNDFIFGQIIGINFNFWIN